MTVFRLEVVVIPVSDVDRPKQFYQSLGWRLDADVGTGDDFRVVQVTPTGSPASIIFGTGVSAGTPPIDGLLLAVTDIEAARAELVAAGVEVSEVFHDAGGVFHRTGTNGRSAVGIPSAAAMPRSHRSPTPMATSGGCRNSPVGCPVASIPSKPGPSCRRQARSVYPAPLGAILAWPR